MEATINYSQEKVARMEIRRFVNEGLQDVYDNKLLDFDTTFDELEERYNANEGLSHRSNEAGEGRYHRHWRLYLLHIIRTGHIK